MMGGFRVGQAIVTDPLLGGGSGYALTAVSESVSAEDRVHLLEMPQVSDAMHQDENPGRFLSFHQLPSDAWAVSHRFVHGKRRRAYNRVVVHTLVVSNELLEAVENDAWLLVAKCKFRDPSGEWRLFTELAEVVRDPDVREVFDLDARLPEDPRSVRYKMLAARCDHLKQHWGGEKAFCRVLSQILGAIEAECRVLLPQEPVMEHLLAVAWSTLPRKDRLSVPWTTHLAAGGGAIFRLALTPTPSETRYQQSDQERWVLLGELAKSPAGGGEALAEAVVSHFALFPKIEEGLPDFEPSLFLSGEMREWVRWVLAGGEVPPQGFANAGKLEQFLDLHVSCGEESLRRPWLARGALLRCAALTVVRRSETAKSWSAAVQEVAGALGARKLAWGLPEPGQIVEMIRQATGAREAQAAMGALALFLASPERKGHTPSLDILLDALESRSGGVGALAPLAGLEAVPVFSELAELILQLMPEKAEAAYRVVQRNGGLAVALAGFTPPLRLAYLVPLRAILRVAREAGDRAVAGRVARDFLVPLLAKDPAQAKVGELGETVLEALRAAPEGLVQAFTEWKDGDLYDAAATTLRSWAEERTAEARTVAERLASEIYSGTPDLVRERPSVLGIASALAAAGTPPRHWLVFALAEAAVLDSTPNQNGLRSFKDFLGKAKVEGPGTEEPLKKLLARFHRVSPGSPLGAAHRALVTCLARPLSRYPAEAAAALAKLSDAELARYGPELKAADLLLPWGGPVSAVAAQISGTDPKAASQISRNWWTGLVVATMDLEVFPAGALNLLDLLLEQDAAVVLDYWTPRMPSLGAYEKVPHLLDAFEALAQRHGLRDREFLCKVGCLAWKTRQKKMELGDAVDQTIRTGAALGQNDTQLESALARLFPVHPLDFTRTVLDLLVADGVHPVIKVRLEEYFLEKSLEKLAPWALPDALPPVTKLAGRNNLLLAVSKKMGGSWSQREKEVREFVWGLIKLPLPRYDAVGAFLRVAGGSGEGSFVAAMESRDPDLYEALQKAKRQAGRGDLARATGLNPKER